MEHLILAEHLDDGALTAEGRLLTATGLYPVERVVFVDDNGFGWQTDLDLASSTYRLRARPKRAIVAVAVYSKVGMHFAKVQPLWPDDPGIRRLHMPMADADMLTRRVPAVPPVEDF